ncbi:MAG: hypothetical protein QGI09_05705 [Dehalococcoidia bacterium]|nr:hypothetical protein [Dehalococcoidia bacterium]
MGLGGTRRHFPWVNRMRLLAPRIGVNCGGDANGYIGATFFNPYTHSYLNGCAHSWF